LNIGDWGRGINRSWENDTIAKTIADAPAGGRFCDLGKLGVAEESILHYDVATRAITWSAKSEKIPGFIKHLQNALTVEVVDDNTCSIHTNITANATGIGGTIMGGAIKKNFGKLLKGYVKDWKAYAETGKVSDAKQRELNK
jgi:hypothetical protein